MKKRYLLAATATFASAFALNPALACEVTIGAVGPMSGPAAQWGYAIRGATEFAAEEFNQQGGLKLGDETCKVSVLAVDTKYTAEGAAAAANNLVGEGVKFVIGPIGSPEVTGMKPIASRNGMLMMSNSFAKDAIGPQWPLVFHLGPGPSAWAEPIIQVAKDRFDIKKVQLIAPNDQGGTDIASVNAEVYRNNGIEALEEYYQRGTTNFSPIVTRIMMANPDAVDTASTPPGDAGTLIKQLRQAGFEGPIGRLGGPGTDEIARIAGGYDVLQDFYWYEPVYIDDKVKQMSTDYEDLMGEEAPENNFFYQFTAAARMVLKGIEAAGTADDTEAVAEALRGLPVEDPNLGEGHWIGEEFFGINQELSLPFGVGLIQNGEMQPVVRIDAVTE